MQLRVPVLLFFSLCRPHQFLSHLSNSSTCSLLSSSTLASFPLRSKMAAVASSSAVAAAEPLRFVPVMPRILGAQLTSFLSALRKYVCSERKRSQCLYSLRTLVSIYITFFRCFNAIVFVLDAVVTCINRENNFAPTCSGAGVWLVVTVVC